MVYLDYFGSFSSFLSIIGVFPILSALSRFTSCQVLGVWSRLSQTSQATFSRVASRGKVVMSSKTNSALPPKPSFAPVIFASIACLFSVIVIFLFLKVGPFVYIAYLCTPFAPIGALALARATDIKGRTNNKFDIAKSSKVMKTCGVLAIAGFFIAIPVMYQIAMRFSQI